MRRWLRLLCGVVATLAVAAAVAWVAAAAIERRQREAAAFLTDGGTIVVPQRAAPHRRVLWSPGERLEAFATEDDEYEPVVSAGGDLLLFVRGRAGGGADIWFARRLAPSAHTAGEAAPPGETRWGDAAPLVSVNTDENDELGPALSPDGGRLYFYSDRPGGLGGYDLWISRRLEDGPKGALRFGEAVNLGVRVNSRWNEYGPAVTPDGSRLLFASNRPGDRQSPATVADRWPATVRESFESRPYDLFVAPIDDSGLGEAYALAEINTSAHEGSPAVAPLGDFLYFASDRPGGHGGFDIWRARILDEGWTRFGLAENLGASVNSASNELDPAPGSLGFELHYSSDAVAALAPAAERVDYDLMRSISREVYPRIEPRAVDWAGVWSTLWPWLLWLLLLLLATLLLLWMLRSVRWRERVARMSLLARALLLSLLVHMLLLAALTAYRIGTSIGDPLERGAGARVTLVSAAGAGDLFGQVRSGLTSVELRPEEAASTRAPTSPQMRPLEHELVQQVAAPSALRPRPIADQRVADARVIRSEVPHGDIPAIDESSRSLAEFAMPDAPAPDAPLAEAQPRPTPVEPMHTRQRGPDGPSAARAEAPALQVIPLPPSAQGLLAPLAMPSGADDAPPPAHAAVASATTPDIPAADGDEPFAAAVALPAAPAFTAPGEPVAGPSARDIATPLRPFVAGAAVPEDSHAFVDVPAPSGSFIPSIALATEAPPAEPSDSAGDPSPQREAPAVSPARPADFSLALPEVGADAPAPDNERQLDVQESGSTPAIPAPSRRPSPSLLAMPMVDFDVGLPSHSSRHDAPLVDPAAPAESAHRPHTRPRPGPPAPPAFDDEPLVAALGLPEEIAMPGRLGGRVLDALTGEPLAGAQVRLDLLDARTVTAMSDEHGRYELRARGLPDHVAITATLEGFVPESLDVPGEALAGGGLQRDFHLEPRSEMVIALEDDPQVHHLGNDEFQGRINSQFQKRSEGLRWVGRFVVEASQLERAAATVELRLLVKGAQAPNTARINGRLIEQRITGSPGDGSFGELRLPLSRAWLVAGENALEIESRRGSADLDDFEFVNPRVVLNPADAEDARRRVYDF